MSRLEETLCPSCSGSGEGMTEHSSCHACKGKGTAWIEVEDAEPELEEEDYREDPGVPTPPAGYTADELEADNPYTQWEKGVEV